MTEGAFAVAVARSVYIKIKARLHALEAEYDSALGKAFGQREFFYVTADGIELCRGKRLMQSFVALPRVLNIRIDRAVKALELPGRRNGDFVPRGGVKLRFGKGNDLAFIVFEKLEFPFSVEGKTSSRRKAFALEGFVKAFVRHERRSLRQTVDSRYLRIRLPFLKAVNFCFHDNLSLSCYRILIGITPRCSRTGSKRIKGNL